MVLGISFDTVDENRAFAEKFTFPYPLLCDTDRAVGVAYGAADSAEARTARRITYLIDPQGRIAASFGTKEKLDVRAHPAEVLARLG